jgi:hypothetical protein
MTLLPALATSVRLPTGELDENHAIDWVATVLIPMVLHRMEKGYSREWLQTELQKGLREGRLPLAARAVEAADAGDEIADAALRHVCAEMMSAGGKLPEQEPGWMQVWAYGQRALVRGPHKRPQGHRWHDDFVGNIQLCNLIYFVCREFGVYPTRGQATLRAKRTPSGISIVVAALARNGINREEESVQRNIWLGLPGELVRTIAPTLVPAGNYTHEAAVQPQDRQLNHLRRRLLNGASHVSLTPGLPAGNHKRCNDLAV